MFSGCFGPTRAHRQGQCVRITGPCEWLRVNVFRLLWANSSSSARAVCLHRGPVRVVTGEYFQVALGQLELIGKGTVFASRPMRAVAGECFQAALGQLELIGKGSVFASWAHASGCR